MVNQRKPQNKKKTNKSPKRKQVTFTNKPSTLNTARTLQQVESAMAKYHLPNRGRAPGWVGCRLAPWNASKEGNTMLPDGTNVARNVFDMYSFADFTIQNESDIYLLVFAGTPFNSAIRADATSGTVSISGLFNTGAAANQVAPVNPVPPAPVSAVPSGQTWCPLNFNQSCVNFLDNFQSSTAEPFGGTAKLRTISLGWRLSYIGPASTCQGLVTAVSSPLRTDDMILKQVGRVNFRDFASTAVNPFSCAVANPMKILPLDFNYSINKTVASARIEANPHGILRHTTNNFKFVDYADVPYVAVDMGQLAGINYIQGDVAAAFSAVYNNVVGTSNRAPETFSCLSTLEEDWETTHLRISKAKGSYRLETWHCVETIPDSTSAFYTIATAPSRAEPVTIAQTEAKVAAKPAMETTA